MRGARSVLLVGCLCLAMTACTVWRERPVNHMNEATGAEALERTFWNEVKARNWNEVERHLAVNYVGVTPEGKEDRAAALQRIQRVTLREFSLSDVQSELNGTTFIVTCNVSLQGEADGHALPSPVRMMTVWQQQKSGWIIIARTVLPSNPN